MVSFINIIILPYTLIFLYDFPSTIFPSSPHTPPTPNYYQ